MAKPSAYDDDVGFQCTMWCSHYSSGDADDDHLKQSHRKKALFLRYYMTTGLSYHRHGIIHNYHHPLL